NGDLARYLAGHPQTDLHQRVTWALQIADGLAWLHHRRVVWADCTLRNVLLTADFQVRLSDFEGSGFHMKPNNSEEVWVRNSAIAPARYLDPEAPLEANYNGDPRVDIYAFGCVFLELLLSLDGAPADVSDEQLHGRMSPFTVIRPPV
ncbi:kinase-like domain-containing protein, partial [Mycena pura]